MEPLTQAQARQYSPMALAFLGDSVYEVMVREYLLRQANQPAAKLHDQKVQLVCAAFQAAAAERLLPHLTEDEAGVYKRGRNANKHCSPAILLHRIIIGRPDWRACSDICT